MNVARFILRGLGIGRPAPTTSLGKARRWSERVLGLAAMLYVLVLFFPQPLFAHSMSFDNITVYARTPLPIESSATMDHVVERVATSPLYDPDLTFRIFICDSPEMYTFFSPVNRGSFAITNQLSGNIFIAAADLKENKATRFAEKNNERSFQSVVAHEIGHRLIREQMGIVGTYRMSTWLREGYCDYLAGESTLSEEAGMAMLRAGATDHSGAARYFTWRKMVEFLVNDQGLSEKDLLEYRGDEEALKKAMLSALNGV